LLNESSAGANGIGTPLARDGYVELVGPEHFIEGFHPFTCQGIPLRDAFGEVAGVLSASVRRQETASRVRDVLFCATEGLECQLIHEWLLGWVKSVGVGQASWADKLRQDLVQTFALARLEFELAAQEIARGGSTDDVIEKIRAELRRFRRLADTWRDLVEHRHRGDEELWLADVTSNVFDLLATEARFARVQLTLSDPQRFRVLDDRTGLARRILGLVLDAMQAAGPGGRVLAEITRDDHRSVATLLLRARSTDASSVASFGLVSKVIH
jgi:signal transduction histidine kinase